MTIWTAFGSETAVGRVATSSSAACSISAVNAGQVCYLEGERMVPERFGSCPGNPARPRISMLFIFSAVSGTDISFID